MLASGALFGIFGDSIAVPRIYHRGLAGGKSWGQTPIPPISRFRGRMDGEIVRENRPAAIHGVASFAKKSGDDKGQEPLAILNRKSRQNPRRYWITAN